MMSSDANENNDIHLFLGMGTSASNKWTMKSSRKHHLNNKSLHQKYDITTTSPSKHLSELTAFLCSEMDGDHILNQLSIL